MIPAEHLDRSATLLWFPIGETPTDADFEPDKPGSNPHWFRHEAIINAVSATVLGDRPEGRARWIKYGEVVLDEVAIRFQFDRLRGLANAKQT